MKKYKLLKLVLFAIITLLFISCNNTSTNTNNNTTNTEKLDLCKCIHSNDGDWNAKHSDQCLQALKDYFGHEPTLQEMDKYYNSNCSK